MALDDLIQQIKDRPISSIIGMYIPLKKSGANFKGVCPFHTDHDPSLHVHDGKKIFKCFVCDAAGDSITFVQKFKNLEFKDALRELAKNLGLTYEDYESRPKNPKEEMAKKVLAKTAQIYRKLATQGPASEYQEFLKTRGLDPKTAENFQLGMAPHHSVIFEYLDSIKSEEDRQSALQVAEELGLIRASKFQGRPYYDTFRDRLMFPIWDQYGAVQGFTSRAIKADQQPKYLNSIDSFLFNKRQLLYGLHFAKPFIREREALILCEGNMDVIALHQFGFEHSIAVMGVALGDRSLPVVRHLTSNVVLALDSDKAGYEAAKRMNTQLLSVGILPTFLDFSPHKDPDEFLQAKGALALQERIENAPTLLDKLLADLVPEEIPSLFDRKLDILRQAYPLLAPLGQGLDASERLVALAKRLGIQSGPDIIMQEYKDSLSQQGSAASANKPTPRAVSVENLNAPNPPSEPAPEALQKSSSMTSAERTLLIEFIQHPECLEHPQMAEILDLIGSNEVKTYVSKLRELFYEVEESEYPQLVMNLLNKEGVSLGMKEVVGNALFKYRPTHLNEKTIDRLVQDVRVFLKKDRLKIKRDSLLTKQKMVNDQTELHELMAELTQVQKELSQLKVKKRPTV